MAIEDAPVPTEMGEMQEANVEQDTKAAPAAEVDDVAKTAELQKDQEDLSVVQEAEEMPERDRWSSRWSFILAAIGSAVGLGNFWRFPYLMYKHGGGPFLIPYWLSLICIGLPMLLLELGLGQRQQAGDVTAFAKIHSKLRGIGYASVFVAWLVLSYYSVIISWTGIYLIESFTLPWVGDDIMCYNNKTMSRSEWHFNHETLRNIAADCTPVGQGVGDSSEMADRAVIAMCVTWVIVYFSVLYGVKTASKIVWVTMPLPFLLSIVLFFRAVTLPGALEGIEAYVGTWDFDKLREPQIWTDAVGQIFFSLGVCIGVMTSYGSYRPNDAPIISNVFIVAFTNCTFSFFCGFIVFGMLGYMAHEQTSDCRDLTCGAVFPHNITEAQQTCWDECKVPVSAVARGGFGLVFVAFPKAMETMGDGGYFFSLITFIMLYTLGWDSAFSILEAITTVVMDAPVGATNFKGLMYRTVGERFALPIVTLVVSVSAMLMGLLYCADIGLYWLDLVDHYSNNYTMLLDGVLQTVAVGWVWGIPSMTRRVGSWSTMVFVLSSFASAVVLIVLTSTLAIDMAPCEQEGTAPEVCYTGGELGIGMCAAVIVLLGGWAWSFSLSGKTVSEWFDAVFWAGVQELWDYISVVSHTEGVPLGKGTRMIDFFGEMFRVWWMFMVKYLSPVVMTFLIILTLKKDARDEYSGYQRWMNNTMWVCVITGSLLIFLVFAILPGGFGVSEPVPDAMELYKKEQQGAAEAENNEAEQHEPVATEQQ
eukprot:TRINITY_DN1673_c0_g1_i1.p1 TRINITY_DN1673_c0_g1~~TRINITY_DN1673_c0_g1_i1.p1  ORF type:complete len:760 (+),score=340.57 TRINITY_DN1673_c0_g1_i1:131-2410(+)